MKNTMLFDEYQTLSARTLPAHAQLAVMGLGLGGESGEVQELIKKHAGHGHALDKEKLAKELGDVLWYIAAICSVLDINLGDVAQANIEKLKARYPEGFTSEASINRKE